MSFGFDDGEVRFAHARVLALMSCCVLASTTVHAQETKSQDDPYGLVKLMLGVSGKMSSSGGSANVAGITATASGASVSDNLRVTFGGGAQYMHPLHRYFVLGGLFSAQSWQSSSQHSAGGGRNLMLDLAVVPQGRLPITDTIELYIGLPLGVTLDFLNGPSVMAAGVNVSGKDTAVGFNLSAVFGARFALSKSVGLLAEIGYALHAFSHDITVAVPVVGTVSASADITLEQLALNAGVFF
jgi:hypothetical protein